MFNFFYQTSTLFDQENEITDSGANLRIYTNSVTVEYKYCWKDGNMVHNMLYWIAK